MTIPLSYLLQVTMEEKLVKVYFLFQNKNVYMTFDGVSYHFNPYAYVPEHVLPDLLGRNKVMGCNCSSKNKPKKYYIFATEEQLASGERGWII